MLLILWLFERVDIFGGVGQRESNAEREFDSA
jgi:hypothetical protein